MLAEIGEYKEAAILIGLIDEIESGPPKKYYSRIEHSTYNYLEVERKIDIETNSIYLAVIEYIGNDAAGSNPPKYSIRYLDYLREVKHTGQHYTVTFTRQFPPSNGTWCRHYQFSENWSRITQTASFLDGREPDPPAYWNEIKDPNAAKALSDGYARYLSNK